MIENLLTILELEASVDLSRPLGFSRNQAETKGFFLKEFFFPAVSLAFLHFRAGVELICAFLIAFSHNISETEFPCDGRAWRECL